MATILTEFKLSVRWNVEKTTAQFFRSAENFSFWLQQQQQQRDLDLKIASQNIYEKNLLCIVVEAFFWTSDGFTDLIQKFVEEKVVSFPIHFFRLQVFFRVFFKSKQRTSSTDNSSSSCSGLCKIERRWTAERWPYVTASGVNIYILARLQPGGEKERERKRRGGRSSRK